MIALIYREIALSLRARNKQEKGRRIAEAAWAVFVERGYEAATTREIAARAGVAAGTLFLYAPDKRALVIQLFQARIGATLDAAFAGLPPDGAFVDDLVRVFRALFTMYAAAPDLARVFVKEVQFLPEAHRETVDAKLQAFFARLATRLVRAQAAGEVDPAVRPEAVVPTLFVIYYGALTAWLSGRASLDDALEVHLRAMLGQLMRGLAPREGR